MAGIRGCLLRLRTMQGLIMSNVRLSKPVKIPDSWLHHAEDVSAWLGAIHLRTAQPYMLMLRNLVIDGCLEMMACLTASDQFRDLPLHEDEDVVALSCLALALSDVAPKHRQALINPNPIAFLGSA